MALYNGYLLALSMRHIGMLPMIGTTTLALSADEFNVPNSIDPKQILMGVLSACAVMLFILLMCVLIAYLSMAAMKSF